MVYFSVNKCGLFEEINMNGNEMSLFDTIVIIGIMAFSMWYLGYCYRDKGDKDDCKTNKEDCG